MSKFNDLIQGDKPVLVDFYADWCGPCKIMAPILREVKSALGDSVSIIKVDVDRNNEVAAKYNVRNIPTLILFRKGQQRWRQAGVVPREALIDVIRKNAV